jgi:histidinol-phosphate aminotransferase
VIDAIGKRTRVIYIGNPSESIGSFFTEAELVFLMAYAEQAMMIVDESFYEFSGLTAIDFVRKFPNLTIIRSFARAFGLAGLKASYAISDPENIGYFARVRAGDAIDAITQTAAEGALDYFEHTREYISRIDSAKKTLSLTLPEIGYDFYVAPADFLLLRVSDPDESCSFLVNNGIAAADLRDIKRMDDFIKVDIGNPRQTENLLLILSRMAERFATGFNRNRLVRSLNMPERVTATFNK